MVSKRVAAEKAVDYLHNGMTVGLGTGSTVYYAIKKLGLQVKQGLNIQAIATSVHSEEIAVDLGIKVVSFSQIEHIDITIDGADEVDSAWNLIKGGGGALLREKIVAASSKQLIVIVDDSKVVNRLGVFPLPIEIIRFGYEMTIKKIDQLCHKSVLRTVDGKPYITDNGNYIVDCDFGAINNPRVLHDNLNQIVGVVDNGLFIDYADRVIVGYGDGSVKELQKH